MSEDYSENRMQIFREMMTDYLTVMAERHGFDLDWNQINERLDEYEAYLNEPVSFDPHSASIASK